MERQHVLAVLHEHHAYLQKLVSDIHERFRQLEATDAEMRSPAADSSHQLLLLTQCLSTEAAFFHQRLQAFLTEDRPLGGQTGELAHVLHECPHFPLNIGGCC